MSSVKTSPSATRVAPLPSIPVVRTDNPALNQCLEAMRAHLEVRQGERGNPWERAVTLRDLQALGVDPAKLESLAGAATAGSRRVPTAGSGTALGDLPSSGSGAPGGSVTLQDAETLARSILDTQLFRTLSKRLDDATRFDFLPQVMQAALTTSIAQEAAARGADIRRVEDIVRNGAMQFAQRIEEVTAALQGTAAGVRQVAAAYADGDRAVASQVTQVEARLDNFDGGSAAVEQVMSAIADRATGLEAQYTVKVQAGGAVAGFGIAATSPVGGTPSSAFIIQADKFALVQPGYAGGMTNVPASWRVPFSVDTVNNKVVVNGSVVVSGNLLAGGTITSTNIDVSGRVKAQGGEAFHAGWSSALKAPIYGVNDLANDYSVTRFGVVGYGASCSGVIGYSTSSIAALDSITNSPRNAGVVGIGGYGGYFRNLNSSLSAVIAEAMFPTGVAAEIRGAIKWGVTPNNFTIPAPPNNTTQFLRADGTWAAPGSSGVSSFNGRTGAVTLTNSDVATATSGNTLAVNITGNAATVASYGAGDLIVRGGSGFTLTVPGVGTWPGCTIT